VIVLDELLSARQRGLRAGSLVDADQLDRLSVGEFVVGVGQRDPGLGTLDRLLAE